MINIKPNVCNALKTIDNINITSEYPKDWSKFPIVTYTEEDNSTYSVHDNEESTSRVIYRIDIWHDRSISDIALSVDKAICKLGLKRTFCKDAPDSSGLKHKVLRFEGIIDVKTLRVYQRN